MEESRRTELFESYADEVTDYRQKMREVSEVVDQYTDNLRLFEQDDLNGEQMLQGLENVSRKMVELDLQARKLRAYNPPLESDTDIVAHLTEAELTRIKLEENDAVDVEARDMAMGGLTSIEDKLMGLSKRLFDKILQYESDLLEEELGRTLKDEYQDLLSQTTRRASMARSFQDILENPRDAGRPYTVDDGTEILEAARDRVREGGPDHPSKLENSYPSEKIEENNSSIEEALERVENSEPRYIQ